MGKKIAEYLKIDSDYVIVNKLHIRNPNYGSRSYNLNPEAIMIYDEKQSNLKSLDRYTTELVLVRLSSDDNALETVQVYAPQDPLSTVQSQQDQSQLQEKIEEILLSP